MHCTINIKTRITIFEDLFVLILTQAGLVCDFYLRDFALMQLANLQHFANLCDNFWFNTIWHRRYTIFFSLTFRNRVSSILGQAFRYSPQNAFYIFNQQIYFII